MPILLVAVGVVAFMLWMIVPTFAKVYIQFRAELPLVTKSLVWLSGFMISYTWLILLSILAIYFGCRYYNRTPGGKRFFDLVKLKLPLVGKILRKVAIARFCQTFSSMTNGGVPIIKALSVSGETSGNTIIQESVTKVVARMMPGRAKMMSIRVEPTTSGPTKP